MTKTPIGLRGSILASTGIGGVALGRTYSGAVYDFWIAFSLVVLVIGMLLIVSGWFSE